MVSNETLLEVVSRLEAAISRLNNAGAGGAPAEAEEEEQEIVRPYSEFWNKAKENLLSLIELSKQSSISEGLLKATHIAIEGLCLHQDILENAEHHKLPGDDVTQSLQKKIMEIIKKSEELGNTNRDVTNHCGAITNGMNALFWITVRDGCAEIVQQYSDMMDGYRNKIFLKKDEKETNWIKLLKEIFVNLLKLVKMEYKVGVNFNFNGKPAEELVGILGANFKYFTENQKFKKNVSTSSKKKETAKPATSSASATPAARTKNSDFLDKVKETLTALVDLAKASNQEGLDSLTQLICEDYSYMAYFLENSKKYKLPDDKVMGEVTKFFSSIAARLKEINTKDIAPFKDIVENQNTSFYWFTKREDCADIAQAYIDMMDLGANKIFIRRVQPQTDWVKKNKELSLEMVKFIKMNYKTGLDWTGSGSDNHQELIENAKKSCIIGSCSPSQTQCCGGVSSVHEVSESGAVVSDKKLDDKDYAVSLDGSKSSKLTLSSVGSILLRNCDGVEITINGSSSVLVGNKASCNISVILNGKKHSL